MEFIIFGIITPFLRQWLLPKYRITWRLLTQRWPLAFIMSVALQMIIRELSARKLSLYCKHSTATLWGRATFVLSSVFLSLFNQAGWRLCHPALTQSRHSVSEPDRNIIHYAFKCIVDQQQQLWGLSMRCHPTFGPASFTLFYLLLSQCVLLF